MSSLICNVLQQHKIHIFITRCKLSGVEHNDDRDSPMSSLF